MGKKTRYLPNRRGMTLSDRVFYKLDRERIWEKQKRRCFYCKTILERHEITMDHRVPLSQRRAHSVDNCVVACADCNSQKASMSEEEFLQEYQSEFPLESKPVSDMEPWEVQLYNGLHSIEQRLKKFEYRMDSKTRGGYNKWVKYWAKRGRFDDRTFTKPLGTPGGNNVRDQERKVSSPERVEAG